MLHDIGKGLPKIRTINKDGQPSDHGHEIESAKISENILTRLGYSAKFIKRVVWLVARHMRFAPMLITGEKTLLRWLRSEATSGNFKNNKEMYEAFEQLIQVFLSDMRATKAKDNLLLMNEGENLGKEILLLAKEKMPVHTCDLALSGKDLKNASFEVSNIKDILKYLLNRVQAGNLLNEKQALLDAAINNAKRKSHDIQIKWK